MTKKIAKKILRLRKRRIFFAGNGQLYAIQFPELFRCRSGLLAEDGDEVADIAVAAQCCNAVDGGVRAADQEFLCTADAQEGDIGTDRIADKTLEKTGQILWGDVERQGEIIYIKRVGKMTFDFLYCRADILEIQRMFCLRKTGAKL